MPLLYQILDNKMKLAIRQKTKQFFQEIDLFKVSASLRNDGQAETSRLCSGVFSLLLIAFFMFVFIYNIIQLFQYNNITSTQLFQTQKNLSKPAASNIMIAIAPTLQNYSAWSTNFEIFAYMIIQNEKGQIYNYSLELQICRPEMWENYTETYTQFQFNNKVCIKEPRKVELQGSNVQGDINYLLIQIKRCNQSINANCQNDSAFYDSFVKLYQKNMNYGVFYIPDLSINAESYDSFQEFIQLNYYLYFTSKLRQKLSIYLGTHIVQTDTSMAPLINVPRRETRYFINRKIQQNVNLEREKKYNNREIYGEVFVYMSNVQIFYERRVGKVDDVIAYAGGLFGIIIALFWYCVFNYNKFSYELQVAETAFTYDAHGQKIRERHFIFFTYIKYQIFSWIKLIFCCELNWPDCKKIEQSRDEANKFMGVDSLFRRVQIFQLLLSYLVDPNKFLLITLTQPESLPKAKQKRLMIEYYQCIMGEDVAIRTRDVRTENQSLKLYLKVREAKEDDFVFLGLGDGEGKASNPIGGQSSDKQNANEKLNQNQNMMKEQKQMSEDQHMKSSQESPLQKQKRQLKQNIRNLLTSSLQIDDDRFLDEICSFPEIFYESQRLQLGSEMQEIQKIFAQAYKSLSPEKRLPILQKISYKIIHRLAVAISNTNINEAK